MARPPLTEAELIERYGPHLNHAPPGGWDREVEVDEVVETHCCFCGQQCGIKLKVADNAVVGFEPWYDFPFNEGKLCPKGVKRYLQGSHPDRLTTPLQRTEQGFEPIGWDPALDRVAGEIRRIQDAYGKDAFSVISGSSLTTEKTYLMGKFARLAIGTANIDYNGRLCMVSAAGANKKALGMDRASNSWADIPLADVVFVAGANIAECAPITTDYIWRARDNGASLIMADPRVTPLARTADCFLGLRPGTDSALMGAILNQLIARDLLDHDFIAQHTIGFEEAAAAVADMTPKAAQEITGVPASRIEQAAELWGRPPTGVLLHARGIEHHTKGVQNVLSCINLGLATGRYGKPGCGVMTITGQANGQGGREMGQKADQLPGGRDISNPEHRAVVAERWGVSPDDIPQAGLSYQEQFQAVLDGDIKGMLLICTNPMVALPDTNMVQAALEKLEFFAVIDFFLSETAHHADLVLAGSLQEEDEGVVTTAEGRCVKINPAITPPGDARRDWEIILDLTKRLGAERYFPYEGPRDIFEEIRRVSAGASADYAGVTWDRLVAEHGIFWPCPSEDHPGTPRLYEGGRFAHPDGKARFIPVTYQPPAEVVDTEYPVWLTTGRVISQFLSGTQTRRIGPLVDQYPEPLVELHPRLAERHGITTGDLVRVTSRRGHIEVPAQVVETIRPDTVFVPYHWADGKQANLLTNAALDPGSKIPEYKVCAVRLERLGPGAEVQDERDTGRTTRTGHQGPRTDGTSPQPPARRT
jgi:assimilatory nitrate reductase catalytic subunit